MTEFTSSRYVRNDVNARRYRVLIFFSKKECNVDYIIDKKCSKEKESTSHFRALNAIKYYLLIFIMFLFLHQFFISLFNNVWFFV